VKKLPKTVRIAGMTYAVRQVACGDILGQHISVSNEIRIDMEACADRGWEIFWHEIIHAINNSNHLELHEGQVATIATAITQVMLDNPAAIPHLLKGERR